MSAYKAEEAAHRADVVKRTEHLYVNHFGSLKLADQAFRAEPSRYILSCPRFPEQGPVSLLDTRTAKEIAE